MSVLVSDGVSDEFSYVNVSFSLAPPQSLCLLVQGLGVPVSACVKSLKVWL